MRTSIITLAVCAAALLVPGMAQAATISYENNQLVYRAAPGERNSLTVYPDQDTTASGKIELSDSSSVPVSYPGGSCEEPFSGTVLCAYPSGGVLADTIDARDGEADVVDCGVGQDTALVDPIDVVSGCENVNTSAGVSGGAGGSGAGGAAGGLAFKLKGLTLTVKCPAACKVSAVLTADKATARKLKASRIASGSARLRKAGTAKVALKVSRKVKRRLTRARTARGTVKVTVTGADGTKQTGAKAVKLGR